MAKACDEEGLTPRGSARIPCLVLIQGVLDDGGGRCCGIVESSLDRGAIRLGREVGVGDVGDSGDGMSMSLPSF